MAHYRGTGLHEDHFGWGHKGVQREPQQQTQHYGYGYDPALDNMYDWGQGPDNRPRQRFNPDQVVGGHQHRGHGHMQHQQLRESDIQRDDYRSDTGALLLLRFLSDGGKNIDACKKALIQQKSSIENYQAIVLGVAADVYAKENGAWPSHPKMSLAALYFNSMTKAEEWLECDRFFKQTDCLGSGVKGIVIPMKEKPRVGCNTFLVTEYDVFRPDEFNNEYSKCAPEILAHFNGQPFCAVTTRFKHARGGWYHDRHRQTQHSRHPAMTCSCFPKSEDVVQLHKDHRYKQLLDSLPNYCATQTIVFELDPKLKKDPQMAPHITQRFTNQKF